MANYIHVNNLFRIPIYRYLASSKALLTDMLSIQSKSLGKGAIIIIT